MMKVAAKIVFLFKDPDGFGTAIADALHPNPNSSVTRLEESCELSLERYGIKDLRACGNLVHFIDSEGNYQGWGLRKLETQLLHQAACLVYGGMQLFANNTTRIGKTCKFSALRWALDIVLEPLGIELSFEKDQPIHRVSVLLLEKCEPPTLVCALNEVLTHLIGEPSSGLPSLMAPFVVASSKLKRETKNLVDSSKISLYGMQIGPETDITRAIATKIQNPPLSLQIHYEPLACFLQLVRVLKFPTSVLIGQTGRGLTDKASEEEFQILSEIGDLLVHATCLHFLREKIMLKPAKTSRDSQEPWRALYG